MNLGPFFQWKIFCIDGNHFFQDKIWLSKRNSATGSSRVFFSFTFCDLAKVVIINKKEDVAKFGYKLIGK